MVRIAHIQQISTPSLPNTSGLVSALWPAAGILHLAARGDAPLLSLSSHTLLQATDHHEGPAGSGSLLALPLGAHGALLQGSHTLHFLSHNGEISHTIKLEHDYDLIGASVHAQRDGTVLLYGGLASKDGLAQIKLAADGTVLSQRLQADTSLNTAKAITATLTLSIGATSYLIVASEGEGGFTSWKITNAGNLSATTMTQNAWFTLPEKMASVTINGTTYILTLASLSSSLSLHRLETNGTLTQLDFVLDSLETRFEHGSAMVTAMLNGQNLVILAGRDGGVSVLQILPEGRLIARAHIADTDAMSLKHISSLAVEQNGNSLFIYASSSYESGITKLEITLDGQVIIQASAGALMGTAGADVLLDGPGITQMTGGAGADLFVLSADGETTLITDFELGIDRIDLSKWPDLRSLLQLQILKTETGFSIQYFAETLHVRSSTGKAIDPILLQHHDLFNLDHLPPELPFVAPDAPLISSHILYGSGGNDVLFAPVITGSEVYALEGNDVYWGNSGHETVYGGPGNDTLMGRAGDDFLLGGPGDDVLVGEDGNDTLFGEADNDYLDGLGGNDILHGGAGNDTILGGNGNDLLYDGFGEDWLVGGAGADVFILSYDRQRDTIADFVLGEDRLDLSQWQDLRTMSQISFVKTETGLSLYYAGEELYLAGFTHAPSAFSHADLFGGAPPPPPLPGELTGLVITGNHRDEVFHGTPEMDRIDGGDGHDLIYGYAGDDWLLGGGGNDTLDGGSGADRMEGQSGDDVYYVDNPNDLILEAFNEGYDRIYSTISFQMPNNFEFLQLLGTDSLSGTGTVGDDLIIGNSGNNYLRGGAGFDWLSGREGNDILEGGRGRDWLVGGPGADIFRYISITDSPPGQDNRDFINWFEPGIDKIDLSPMDAVSFQSGDQAFKFIGQNGFTGSGGELRYASWNMGWLILEGDVNGDGRADFQIFVNQHNHISVDDIIL